MLGNWFSWWGYKRRYEECRKTGVATAEELHKIIEFADLRIKELETERDSLKAQVEEALKASRTSTKKMEVKSE